MRLLKPGGCLYLVIYGTPELLQNVTKFWVGECPRYALRRRGSEDHPGVPSLFPERGIESFPQFIRAVMPGPAQIQCQLSQHCAAQIVIPIRKFSTHSSPTRITLHSPLSSGYPDAIRGCLRKSTDVKLSGNGSRWQSDRSIQS